VNRMNRHKKQILALGTTMLPALLLALPAAHVAAQESEDDSPRVGLPELIQEFALSETVYPQEKGETQITLSTLRLRNDDGRLRETGLKVEYGITKRLQIELEAPYVSLRPNGQSRQRGFGDTSLGLSYNLRPGGGRRTAVSLGFAVSLPTGNERKELGTGKTIFEPSVVLAQQVGKAQVHLSFGTELGGVEREYSYNLAAVYPMSRKFYPTLELNGFRAADEGNRVYLTPGAVYRIGKNAEVSVGIPVGLHTDGQKIGPVGKFTIEF
jgi:hypothetical protein